MVPEATAAGPALHRVGLGWGEGHVREGPPPPTLLPAPVSLGYSRVEAAPAAAQPWRELLSPPRAGSRGTSPTGPGALGPRLTTLVCPPWAAQAPGLHAGVQLLGPALPLTSVWPGPGLPPAPRAPSGRQGAAPPCSGRPGPGLRPRRPRGPFPSASLAPLRDLRAQETRVRKCVLEVAFYFR